MSIISLPFILFLIIFGILYFISPKRIQWIILLAGNLFFYACSGYQYLIYLLGCTFITWFAAGRIERNSAELKSALASAADKDQKAALRKSFEKKNRLWIGTALFFVLGSWIVLKYGPLLLDSFSVLFRLNNLQGAVRFIVPLGMSFYTFDAVSYMIDVSRGKYPAEKNFFKYMTFISYFPHIVQGPFSRFGTLSRALFAEHGFSFDRLSDGFRRILWGYAKKLIIAEKLSLTVNEIFSGYEKYDGVHILFVMVLYGIELYADFSGYIDIVSGISHVLGIDLDRNFRQPFFSVSVEEFWRRWHMTLGQWFRDYVFFPVSRSERVRKIRGKFSPAVSRHVVSFIAMFWVWSGSGLWHGANWTFLVWGWLNMLIMFISQILEPWYRKTREFFHISLQNKIWNGFRILRTFLIVCFLFFITRADSLKQVIQMLRWGAAHFNAKTLLDPAGLFPGSDIRVMIIVLIWILLMFLADVLCETGKIEYLQNHSHFLVRDVIYVLIIISLILFGGNGEDVAKNFIYAGF